jgi:hypothetical protein
VDDRQDGRRRTHPVQKQLRAGAETQDWASQSLQMGNSPSSPPSALQTCLVSDLMSALSSCANPHRRALPLGRQPLRHSVRTHAGGGDARADGIRGGAGQGLHVQARSWATASPTSPTPTPSSTSSIFRGSRWTLRLDTLQSVVARSSTTSRGASTFARRQSMIADPGLTRKLASQVIVFGYGMLITSARCACCSSFGVR